MRTWLVALLGIALSGCVIEAGGMAGKTCDAASDCPPELVCVLARPGATSKTCEALALPPDDVVGDGGPAYWCDGVDHVLTTYCSACHGEDRTGGGGHPFRLDMYEDTAELQGAKSMAPRIQVRMIDSPTMPPYGSPQPSAGELALVRDWIQSDAPLCLPDAGM